MHSRPRECPTTALTTFLIAEEGQRLGGDVVEHLETVA